MEGLKRALAIAAVCGTLAMIAGAILMTVGVGLAAAAPDTCGQITRTASERACRVPAYWIDLGILALLGGLAVAITGGVALKILKRRGRPSRR